MQSPVDKNCNQTRGEGAKVRIVLDIVSVENLCELTGDGDCILLTMLSDKPGTIEIIEALNERAEILDKYL